MMGSCDGGEIKENFLSSASLGHGDDEDVSLRNHMLILSVFEEEVTT